jgi:hypothetical protein
MLSLRCIEKNTLHFLYVFICTIVTYASAARSSSQNVQTMFCVGLTNECTSLRYSKSCICLKASAFLVFGVLNEYNEQKSDIFILLKVLRDLS